MKKSILLIILLLMTISTISHALDRGHVYINGTVDAVGRDTITISGVTYSIDPQCQVVFQYKENGAVYKKPARLSSINRGDSVYAKKIATILYEIEIEGWKR